MFVTVALIASALLLICVSSLKFASNGLLSTRVFTDALRRKTLDMRELRDAAEEARLRAKLETTKDTGMNWRVMEVAELVDESEDCRSFYLVDPYGQQLPAFRPGQYLMVRPALAGAYQTTRCYSLSSSPNGRYWRITVKRQEFDKQPNATGQKWWVEPMVAPQYQSRRLLTDWRSEWTFLPTRGHAPTARLVGRWRWNYPHGEYAAMVARSNS